MDNDYFRGMVKSEEKELDWATFMSVDMRVGTVLEASVNESARKPALVLHIDFGEFGVKKSSAQITDLYNPEDLKGRQVIAVVNFPPKQIGKVMSSCLVLGAIDSEGKVILLKPDQQVRNGMRIG